MKIVQDKSKWKVVCPFGKHVYGVFKTKRAALCKLYKMEWDLNTCRSPKHQQSRDEIWEQLIKKYYF